MRRCDDCTDMAMESECLAAGRCVLHTTPEEEEWVAVPGFEQMHQVSSAGRLKQLRCPRGRQLAIKVVEPIPTAEGLVVTLHSPVRGQPRRTLVVLAEVVLRSFRGRSRGRGVHYKDGDPTNVRLSNLEWREA